MAPRALLAVSLLALGTILVLADLSPLVADRSRSGATLAAACRVALAPTCHQRLDRTLRVRSTPLAACARCCGLHAGGLAAGIAVLAGISLRPSRAWSLLTTAAAVMAADVALGTTLPAWDHPMLRLATGMAFVLAACVAGAGHLRAPGRAAELHAARQGA